MLLNSSKTAAASTSIQVQASDTAARELLDRQFDRLVYELYDLTGEEVALIEGGERRE